MRKRLLISALMLVAAFVTGCRIEPPLYLRTPVQSMLAVEADVNVNLMWQIDWKIQWTFRWDVEAMGPVGYQEDIEGMSLHIFPHDDQGGHLSHTQKNFVGKTTDIPFIVGVYDLLFHNNDSEVLLFREDEHTDDIYCYTRVISTGLKNSNPVKTLQQKLMGTKADGKAPENEPVTYMPDDLFSLYDKGRRITDNLDDYELNLAAEKIYDFIWAEFCDWYIEMAKSALYGEDGARKENVAAVLIQVLGTSMKLLHPFMPFITEELYQQLPGHEETIMLSAWPKAAEGKLYAQECATMETIMDLVKSIRNIRADLKVPPAQRIEARIITAEPKALEGAEGYLLKLAGVEKTTIGSERGQVLKSDVHIVTEKAEAFIPLASLVDLDKERERIDKEIERVKGDIARANGKLANAKFVSRAPEAVVNEERRKLQAGEEMLQKLQERREALAE